MTVVTKEKFDELVGAGKKAYLADNFEEAVTSLSEACNIAAELFGDLSPESYEALYYYGQSLTEVYRQQQEIVSQGNKTVDDMENPEEDAPAADEEASAADEESTEQEKKAEEGEVSAGEGASSVDGEEPAEQKTEEEGAATGEEASAADEEPAEQQAKTEEGEAAVGEEAPTADEESADQEAKAEEEEAAAGEEAGDADETMREETEDDNGPSDGILAFETLEVCRKICQNQLEKDPADQKWLSNKADVMLALCESAVVDGRPEQAKEAIVECIETLEGTSKPCPRRLSQAHMYAARAYMAADAFADAAKEYEKAHNILKDHRETLETNEEGEKERAELAELMQDIKERMDDAQRSEEMFTKAKEELAAKIVLPSKAEGEAQDITSMIRKGTKRPAEELLDDDAKKPKTDEVEESKEMLPEAVLEQ
uniref:SHNi-TPR domain-containing protein n=1 Tax=Steinernema glaseri TaxID=37863 RepID=A0A1I7Z255_9BILA